MMEQWNNGIMGSGIMQCCINGPATGGVDDKIKMANSLQKTNIPPFHHSMRLTQKANAKSLCFQRVVEIPRRRFRLNPNISV
jgi:hypothetical protein